MREDRFGVAGLTRREREVVEAVCRGMTNKAIARQLGIRDKTVEFHLGHVFRKAGVASRTELLSLLSGARLPDDERGNLPPGRELVGRDDLAQSLTETVQTCPLVTLVGPGGVGKSALAIEVASRSEGRFADGVWWTDLATASSDDDVVTVTAQALGLQLGPRRVSAEAVASALASAQVLLLLDTCEHVVAGAAALAATLHSRCSGVRVLATSRCPLAAPGERVVSVEPLGVDLGDAPSAAAQLFARCGVSADPDFDATDQPEVIADVCRALDGLPLALELAAARLSIMSLTELHARLDDRFRLVRRHGRDGDRHDSLWATVEWSYGWLPPDGRRLLDALAVFDGDFDLTAAEAVGAAFGHGDAALDLLQLLVAQSLVIAGAGDRTRRFRLLDTIREFGRRRLARTGALEQARRAHLDVYLAFTEAACHGERGPDEVAWHRAIKAEWHNCRTALRTAVSLGDGLSACRIIERLVTWSSSRVQPELECWAEAVAAMPGADEHPEFVAVLAALAVFPGVRGDHDRARELAEQALAVQQTWHGASQPWGTWALCHARGSWAEQIGFAEDLERYGRDHHDIYWEVMGAVLAAQWTARSSSFDPADEQAFKVAIAQLERARGLAEAQGRPGSLLLSAGGLAAALRVADPARAREYLLESLTIARMTERRFEVSIAACELVRLEASCGDTALALDHAASMMGAARSITTPAVTRRHVARYVAGCLGAIAGNEPHPDLERELTDVLGHDDFAEAVENGRTGGLQRVNDRFYGVF